MNDEKPLVTVLIPAYNHEAFVKDAIISVLNQTYGYGNIQLIVADDFSSDGTASVIREMVNEYNFEFLEHKKNIGLSSTLNEMISLSKGKYVTCFASDDILIVDRIEKQIEILIKNETIDILVGEGILIDEKGDVISKIPKNLEEPLISYSFDEIFLFKWPGFNAGTAIIKRELYYRIGTYDPAIKVEDYYFWLKASYNGAKIAKCNIPFLYYRVHQNSASSNNALIENEVFKILSSYKDHPNYSKAVQNRKIYNLSRKIFVSKVYVIKYIIKCPELLINMNIIKVLIMILMPSILLKKKFPENYVRRTTH